MKAEEPPFTITSNDEQLYYCRPCRGYRPGQEFFPSYLARKCRQCKGCIAKKRKGIGAHQRMLQSVKMICRRTDTKLASRWELADIIGLLAGGKMDASGKRKSDISGKTAEKYSIVPKKPNAPFTPANALVITRREAMTHLHLCPAN